MLMPKKVKFRKDQRGRMKGLAKARTVVFGTYGLQAIEPKWLTAAQIESMRMTISRRIKKIGKLFLRVFPDKPVTKKPAETRMGKGKGNPEFWVSVIKRGRIICELADIDEVEAKDIFRAAAHKLPMKTRFIKKIEEEQEEL
jgi:large subunit ribosomal protein L16